MKERKIVYLNYDLDANTFKYGRHKGPYQGQGGITCAGGTTTVTAVTSGIGTFSPLRVGDAIWIRTAENTVVKRKVATKTSNDQISVTGANLTAFTTAAWEFFQFDIGTAADSGALYVANVDRAWVEFDWTLADSLDVAIEVRGMFPAAKWATVWTGTFAAAAAPQPPVEVTELVGHVRVGLKSTTGFAGTDDISVYLATQVGAR